MGGVAVESQPPSQAAAALDATNATSAGTVTLRARFLLASSFHLCWRASARGDHLRFRPGARLQTHDTIGAPGRGNAPYTRGIVAPAPHRFQMPLGYNLSERPL